MSCAGNRSR